jgi:hypothetical protein
MLRNFKALIYCLSFGGFMMTFVSANAATLDLATVGTFSGTQSRGGNTVSGDRTSTIEWGVSPTDKFNSGYDFSGNNLSTDTAGSFSLGTLTHRNGTIWRSDSTLESANLNLGFSGQLAGQDIGFSRTLSFTHNETLNSARPCAISGSNPCGDGVMFSLFDDFSLDFSDGDTSYRLTISGFFDNLLGDGNQSTNFYTDEMQYSYAYLVGNLVIRSDDLLSDSASGPSPVPLPASGLMLLAGLLGLFGARWRN